MLVSRVMRAVAVWRCYSHGHVKSGHDFTFCRIRGPGRNRARTLYATSLLERQASASGANKAHVILHCSTCEVREGRSRVIPSANSALSRNRMLISKEKAALLAESCTSSKVSEATR